MPESTEGVSEGYSYARGHGPRFSAERKSCSASARAYSREGRTAARQIDSRKTSDVDWASAAAHDQRNNNTAFPDAVHQLIHLHILADMERMVGKGVQQRRGNVQFQAIRHD